MLGVSDSVGDCVRLAIPQATELQLIRSQIDAAFVFAGPDFVNVCSRCYLVEIQSRWRWSLGGNREQHIARVRRPSPGSVHRTGLLISL